MTAARSLPALFIFSQVTKNMTSMPLTVTLTLIDGVRIVVPNSLERITPYVLQEQMDWFEDEIKFLRRLLQAGQKVIDIGANCGVYTLSMAKSVGAKGCVWAFEPASIAADLLAQGIAINGFAQVVLEKSALSNTCGMAELLLNSDPEGNELARGKRTPGASEIVPLVTLDECFEKYGWQDIGFVKIDAEGEEANILIGGQRFFAELSPLVQYEVKAGTDLNMGIVGDFAEIGYESYRLVPGLDFLIPFDAGSVPDGFLLNLFCCKQDRARQLAADGFLLDSEMSTQGVGVDGPMELMKPTGNRHAYHWRHTIAKLPYGMEFAKFWTQAAEGSGFEVDEALSFYAISRDSSFSSKVRFFALEISFGLLKTLCEHQASHLRLASLARVARDYGYRSIAASALQSLGDTILHHHKVDLREPFLAPGERFDYISPDKDYGNWALAAVLEELERAQNFSSYYSGLSTRERLERIHSTGFGSPETDRRLHLLKTRFHLPIQ